MRDTRSYFSWERSWTRAGLALAFLTLIVLSPKSLFSGRGVEKPREVRRVMRVAPQDRGWVYETVRAYSVLKSHRTQLPDFLAWGVAKAIIAESRRHNIDPMLILAIIKVESGFRPVAVSPRGAVGLMQILPFVARALAEELELTSGAVDPNLYDPALNLRLGVHYLMQLKNTFRDMRLALVAYNRGPSDVRKRLREKRPVPPGYADKVMAVRKFFNGLTPSVLAAGSNRTPRDLWDLSKN